MAETISLSYPNRVESRSSLLSLDVDEDAVSVSSSANPGAAIVAAWNNLSAVMRMFSRQSHVKDSASWLAAVCQYLGEAVQPKLTSLISYLSELLERGPVSYQNCLLHIICNFLQIIDLQKVPKEKFNTTTIHTLLHRFMLQTNSEWKSALSALKLIVTRSSTLCSPNSSQRRVQQISSALEEAVVYRRQIPGRTLSFTYNFPIPPIGGNSNFNSTAAASNSVSSKTAPNGGAQISISQNKEQSCKEISCDNISATRIDEGTDASLQSENVDSDVSRMFARPVNLGTLRSRASTETGRESAAKSDPAQATSSRCDTQSTLVSRSPSIALARQISVGNNSSSTESQNSNWRRPLPSQRRVREKLTGVIRSFGPTTAALARSPSVVFSSTNDVDFQAVPSAASNIIPLSAGYEMSSHPAAVLGGLPNGENTPVERHTTGHGSIEDMNNIVNMDLGTPSGREDAISLDIYDTFGFLYDEMVSFLLLY